MNYEKYNCILKHCSNYYNESLSIYGKNGIISNIIYLFIYWFSWETNKVVLFSMQSLTVEFRLPSKN